MRIVVLKFGGTSVDSHEHRLLAARKVLEAKEAGFSPVGVVSAIGRAGAPYATDTLVNELNRIDPHIQPNKRELDMMMACGEIISAVVMAHTLKTIGCQAIALSGGQAGIITDQDYGNARITSIRPHPVIQKLEQGIVPVVTGFQGVTAISPGQDHGDITTLGRGGSDTTASALGAALKAEAVHIYTDVDGVKTADPDMVHDARTLEYCSYEEVAEIAHQGAKVVHPRAAEIAMDYGIPLWVKNTFSDHTGTCITTEEKTPCTNQRITGITHTGKIVYIRFEMGDTPAKPEIELAIYRMLARAGVNIYLVTFSRRALSFAVPRDLYPTVKQLFDGLVVPVGFQQPGEATSDIAINKNLKFFIFRFDDGTAPAYLAQRELMRNAEEICGVKDIPAIVVENCTMVSVIAGHHRDVPGVMAEIYEALYDAGITVLQTADSDSSVSCLVSENEVEKAVRVLHQKLELANETSETG